MSDEAIDMLAGVMSGKKLSSIQSPRKGAPKGVPVSPAIKSEIINRLESAMAVASLLTLLASLKNQSSDKAKMLLKDQANDLRIIKQRAKDFVEVSDMKKLDEALKKFNAAAALKAKEGALKLKSLGTSQGKQIAEMQEKIAAMIASVAGQGAFGPDQVAAQLRMAAMEQDKIAAAAGNKVVTDAQKLMLENMKVQAAVKAMAEQVAQQALQHLKPASATTAITTAVSWLKSKL